MGEWGEFTSGKRFLLATHHPWFLRPGHPLCLFIVARSLVRLPYICYLVDVSAANILSKDVNFFTIYR